MTFNPYLPSKLLGTPRPGGKGMVDNGMKCRCLRQSARCQGVLRRQLTVGILIGERWRTMP